MLRLSREKKIMKDCCRKTADEINRILQEGMEEFETNESGGIAGICPYLKRRAWKAHWWTRGYAYQARLYRALKAELGKQ
jgi:hypothetical protein